MWCINFVERHSFRIASGDSPETLRKLYLSTKFHTRKLGEITLFFAVYCKDIQICMIFGTHEEYLQRKYRSFRAENNFVISKFLIRRCLCHIIGRQYFIKTVVLSYLQHTRWNIFTQNSQDLMFLFPFITTFYEYPLIHEI